MIDRVFSTLRCTLARVGLAGSAVLLAVFYVIAVSPGPSDAGTSDPRAGAACTHAAPFPYGSAVVGIAATPDDGGYWIVTNDGYVAACGDAPYLGEQTALNAPIVGIAATPDGGGYYLVASDGGVFTFGDARFQGSTGSLHLNKPVVGMTVDPATGGYWLVATDGGIFAYSAPFLGSTGSITLNKPVVGMATTRNGSGYWLVASDGGIFAYGVPFWGSTGSIHLNKPVVGMASDAATTGYWLVASDGGIFAFNAPFYGSTGSIVLNAPIVGMEATATGSGYRFIAADGGVFTYGTSGFYGTPVFSPPPPPTSTPTPTPAPTPAPTPTPSQNCTEPVYTSSNAEATWNASNGYLVNNNAWSGSAGPQTISVCNYDSWYVMSDQPNDGGAIETYPDTEDDLVSAPYSCTMPNCGPKISSMSAATSTFGISVPSGTNIGYDAAYDTWVDGLNTGNCEEVMVWNQYENDLNGYTFTDTDQSIGGTTWNVLWEGSPGGGECGYVAFVMTSQESSGTVNLLAIYNWVIDNHPGWFDCSSTVACEAGGSNPAELSTIEYGVEIAYTDGSQEFAVTNFSATTSG